MASDPAKTDFTHIPPSLQPESYAQVKDCSEEVRAAHGINFSVDLVLAAKRYLGLLRNIDSLPCLHGGPGVIRAIQRSFLLMFCSYYSLTQLSYDDHCGTKFQESASCRH